MKSKVSGLTRTILKQCVRNEEHRIATSIVLDTVDELENVVDLLQARIDELEEEKSFLLEQVQELKDDKYGLEIDLANAEVKEWL